MRLRHSALVLVSLATSAALLSGCGGAAPAPTAAPTTVPTSAPKAASTVPPKPVTTGPVVTPGSGGGGTGGGGGAGAGGGQRNQPTPVVGALFQVSKPDGASVAFTKDDLAKLPLHTIMVEGKPQEGPALLDVLKQAGVTDFKSLTMIGRDNYTFTVTRAQVDTDTLLDFANRGTVKFASLKVPKADWPQDITLIKVE